MLHDKVGAVVRQIERKAAYGGPMGIERMFVGCHLDTVDIVSFNASKEYLNN